MRLTPAARLRRRRGRRPCGDRIVALMVVADRKERLALRAQRRNEKGLRIGQLENLADLPVEVTASPGLSFLSRER